MAIPAAIENVSGMITAISITGTTVARSSKSIPASGARNPAATKTRAGAVAKPGIEANRGWKNRHNRNSAATVSAAEILVLCLRALPNVTHLGDTTRGALSDMLWKRLPNGWTVSLSNEVYADADGRLWEGKGIPPEVRIEVSSARALTAKQVKAVRAVAAMAREDR